MNMFSFDKLKNNENELKPQGKGNQKFLDMSTRQKSDSLMVTEKFKGNRKRRKEERKLSQQAKQVHGEKKDEQTGQKQQRTHEKQS